MNRLKMIALAAKRLEGHYWSATNQDAVAPYCIQLPIINRDKIQDRFHEIDGKVCVIVCACYSSLKGLFLQSQSVASKSLSRFSSTNVEEDHGRQADSAYQGFGTHPVSEWNSIYLTGPKGVGKSYLLCVNFVRTNLCTE